MSRMRRPTGGEKRAPVPAVWLHHRRLGTPETRGRKSGSSWGSANHRGERFHAGGSGRNEARVRRSDRAYCGVLPGKLLVRNAGGDAFSKKGYGFAVCTRCGFAMSEEKPPNGKGEPSALPKSFQNHASVFSSDSKGWCWPKGAGEFVLRHKVLAAKEKTDVLLLHWPGGWKGEPDLYSLGRALVLAGTRLLELDSRELAMDTKRRREGKISILLYDTVPGAAGHCLELLERGRDWLEEARNILQGSAEHNETCRRACIDCILDFAGQHNAHKLDRRKALEVLNSALGDSKSTLEHSRIAR